MIICLDYPDEMNYAPWTGARRNKAHIVGGSDFIWQSDDSDLDATFVVTDSSNYDCMFLMLPAQKLYEADCDASTGAGTGDRAIMCERKGEITMKLFKITFLLKPNEQILTLNKVYQKFKESSIAVFFPEQILISFNSL